MLKYSFVLPAYKARFLGLAIDSILSQTYRDFELVIVNDCSPDNIDDIVFSYKDPRIKYYKNDYNIGGKDLVAQWNRSIKFSEGEYVILASDDDIYDFEYLLKMDKLISEYPEVDAFRPGITTINDKNEIIRKYESFRGKISPLEYIWNLHRDKIGSAISYYVFNKAKLLSIGGFVNFPKAWGSDDATVMLMGRNGIACAEEYLFSFRLSGENISTTYDENTVLQKLHASDLYYNFVKSYVNTVMVESQNSIDVEYAKNILDDLDGLMQRNIRWIIDESSLKTLIRSLKYLIKSEYIDSEFIIKRFARKVLRIFGIK